MSPDDKAIIMGWLRQTDIAYLELSGPDSDIRLENLPCETVEDPADSATRLIRSPHAGVFLVTHPLRRKAIVEVGSHVNEGQILGLLQSGPLLLPVKASCEGRVMACLCSNQTLVGYGTPLFQIRS